MKHLFKISFGFLLITILSGLTALSAAKISHPPQTIFRPKPALVQVKADVGFELHKKQRWATCRLTYNGVGLKGWQVKIDGMKMSYQANGVYNLPATSCTISPGKSIIMTMTPPLLIRSGSPASKFQAIKAIGRVGKLFYVTYPKHNTRVDVSHLRQYLKITWTSYRGADTYLWRLGPSGNHVETLVSNQWMTSGANTVSMAKLKAKEKYRIHLNCFPPKMSFSGPATKNSFADVVMITESDFYTTSSILQLRRK